MEYDVRRAFQDRARKLGKRERTRAAILDGVVQALAEMGLEGATVKEIAENAGISHGTFYNHFDSRNGSVLAAIAAVKSELLAVVRTDSKMPDQIDHAVVEGIHKFMQAALNRPAWGKVLGLTVGMSEISNNPTDEIFENLLQKGQADGVFRVEITPFLSLQVRSLQALAILRGVSGDEMGRILVPTCEAVLRLLGRTPKEAAITVRDAIGE